MFDWYKPTTQMLGRWQPWHDGHTALFKKALLETGQVCIFVRTVPKEVDASGGRTKTLQNDNPFEYEEVSKNINDSLEKEGFTNGKEYIIQNTNRAVGSRISYYLYKNKEVFLQIYLLIKTTY